MRDWTVELESEPYPIVAEHDRAAFTHALERLGTELSGSADVLGSVVGIPHDGAFSATFAMRAKTAGDAAERGCDVFLQALEEALHPLRFPISASELGAVTGIDAPVIAVVTARAHDDAEPTSAQLGHIDGAPETVNAAADAVEIHGYLVPSDIAREFIVRLRALPGEWNGPAARFAMQLEMTLDGAGEQSIHVDGPERDAVCDALQNWVGEITEGAFAEQLIALMQGLARETAEQQPVDAA